MLDMSIALRLKLFNFSSICTASVVFEDSIQSKSYWSQLFSWIVSLLKRMRGDLNPANLDILASNTFNLTLSLMMDCSSVQFIIYLLMESVDSGLTNAGVTFVLLNFRFLVVIGLNILFLNSFILVGLHFLLLLAFIEGSLEFFCIFTFRLILLDTFLFTMSFRMFISRAFCLNVPIFLLI